MADWYVHKISVVDPLAGKVVAQIAVGDSPSGLAVTPDGKSLLSADRDSDAVSIIDTATNARVKSIPVGKRPFGITIDAEGRRAYTANVASDDVSIIDIATGTVVGTVPVGHRPYAVALARGRAFVTNQYGSSLSVFDLDSLAPVKTIEIGDHPEGIMADATGANVYVACWFDNVLMRIDTDKLTVTGEAAVGDGPRAFGLVFALSQPQEATCTPSSCSAALTLPSTE